MKKSYQTSLERRMRKGLESRGLRFEAEFPTRSGFIIDFLIFCPDGKRLAVECDGERWHMDKRKDRFRDMLILKDERIKDVLRFPGQQINEELSQCLDTIVAGSGLARRGKAR